MRVSYWSCSKFSNWLKKLGGIDPKPLAADAKGWKEYHKKAKEKNKFLYWLSEDGLDLLQDIVYWPKDKLDNFAYWFNLRFISPSHIINTRLSKGSWHETEEKMLHGMFELLVDFVEIEKASLNMWCDNSKKPWYVKYLPYFIHKFIPIRSQQLGVDYLLWETKLLKDDNWFGYTWLEEKEGKDVVDEKRKNNPEYMKPTHQAEAALEILDLYVWWKFIRPMRKDPMDESGYTEYYNSKYKNGKNSIIDMIEDNDEKIDEEWKKCQDKMIEIEESYIKEDDEMLERLIKIRRYLWT
jgi:hypothetical protein